jgi:CBS domain containing-hemolysin-like protein
MPESLTMTVEGTIAHHWSLAHWSLLFAMLLLIALCSLGEAALVAANRGRVRALLRSASSHFPSPVPRPSSHQAMAVWQFLHDRTNLSSLLVGITLLILLTSALVTHMVETVAPSWGEVVGLGVALFIMTFCEVLPKSIGFARAEVLLVRWFPLWRFLVALFRPINRLVYAIAKRTLQLFGADPHRHPPLTLDEIFALLDAGVEAGVIDREEHALAERILRLEEIVVRDIMVPRPDIVALPADSTFDEVMETILQTGHSRLPLYDGTLDNIVGIVYAYDILANIADGTRQPTPRLIARPPLFVPETKRVRELLQEMRTNQVQIAIVLDEYGATAGLVTLEDIVEEIVGELRDEHDRELEPILKLDDHTFIVDARMDRRQFEEFLGVELPDGDFNTIGGFVLTALGHLPTVGEQVTTPLATFVVEEVQRRRITKVRVVLRPPTPSFKAPTPSAENSPDASPPPLPSREPIA